MMERRWRRPLSLVGEILYLTLSGTRVIAVGVHVKVSACFELKTRQFWGLNRNLSITTRLQAIATHQIFASTERHIIDCVAPLDHL